MNTQFEKFVAPIKEINELAVRNFETVAELHLKNAEENVKIGIEQVKNATEVRDTDSLKQYLDNQARIAQQFNDRLVANTRTVIELGNAYHNELQRIMKSTFAV